MHVAKWMKCKCCLYLKVNMMYMGPPFPHYFCYVFRCRNDRDGVVNHCQSPCHFREPAVVKDTLYLFFVFIWPVVTNVYSNIFLCTDTSLYFEADRVLKYICFYRYASNGIEIVLRCCGRLHKSIWLMHI